MYNSKVIVCKENDGIIKKAKDLYLKYGNIGYSINTEYNPLYGDGFYRLGKAL